MGKEKEASRNPNPERISGAKEVEPAEMGFSHWPRLGVRKGGRDTFLPVLFHYSATWIQVSQPPHGSQSEPFSINLLFSPEN